VTLVDHRAVDVFSTCALTRWISPLSCHPLPMSGPAYLQALGHIGPSFLLEVSIPALAQSSFFPPLSCASRLPTRTFLLLCDTPCHVSFICSQESIPPQTLPSLSHTLNSHSQSPPKTTKPPLYPVILNLQFPLTRAAPPNILRCPLNLIQPSATVSLSLMIHLKWGILQAVGI